MSVDDDIILVERTLCQLPSVHVFRIPALNRAGGHRAADWPTDPVWSGKLKIIAKGRDATIILHDDKNGVFAKCPYNEGSVEKVTDSGRYFVLKIVNDQGRHAFIGIAFNERNDAFDFNVALQEHKSECEREDRAAAGELPATIPHQDFSLKEGQKITVKIGNKDGTKREKKPGTSTGGLLAPPGSGRLAPPQERQASASNNTTASFDVFQTGASSSSSSASSSVFSFDSFGSSDPFASSSSSSTQQKPSPSTDPFASSFGSTTSSNSAQVDAFGFPVSSSSSTSSSSSVSTSTSATTGGSVNLLDF
eukprot:CAMPEP_0174820902 /NCGR_PEP_ID=MMETSP1107-20130205/5019_1 /TAXON_ID=36770 /ORGANISM="Paraphysomonas vestita, Strain GFlagA" /LENGTH=306 /DNA_ID=CAMNT_0016037129 /DNA_START=41 /DNA_END=961 /DNA_ORIENTATION=-